jgi:hypothetical protein
VLENLSRGLDCGAQSFLGLSWFCPSFARFKKEVFFIRCAELDFHADTSMIFQV